MFHIICGTYETPLIGYLASIETDSNDIKSKSSGEKDILGGIHLDQIFAYSPHSGAIKFVAASGDWVVSSSTDEVLKYFN